LRNINFAPLVLGFVGAVRAYEAGGVLVALGFGIRWEVGIGLALGTTP
jgi:hypothetical protein